MMMSVPTSVISPLGTTNSKLQNLAIRIDTSTTKESLHDHGDGDNSVGHAEVI